jgi:predicted N-formylglutamate amidohydrolase
MSRQAGLLAPDEPPAVSESGAQATSSFVIVVDHASNLIPRSLGTLGLTATELQRHIAWDIGALDVARQVASALDAVLIAQNYSRLVIDCNRDPKAATSIPLVSEHTHVPGNAALRDEDRDARRREIFEPYHERIRAVLDARRAAGRPTILVAQHTMTDVFKGMGRAMHAAVLYNREPRFARLVRDMLRRESGLVVADNEPYFLSDETDYTIPQHGEARVIPHVEIEIRQDLVRECDGLGQWAARITSALRDAERVLGSGGTGFRGAPGPPNGR